MILKKILKSGKPSRGKPAIDFVEFGNPISQMNWRCRLSEHCWTCFVMVLKHGL